MNAQTQSVKLSRGLGGEDRSYHDPEQGVNLALAEALQELRAEGKLDTTPTGDASPGEGEDQVETRNDMPAEESAASVEETTPPETSTPGDVANEAEAFVTADRRGLLHAVAREMVSKAHSSVPKAQAEVPCEQSDAPVSPERAHFTVPSLELEQEQKKPRQLPRDAPWEKVTLGVFQKKKNAELLSLVRAIRARGARPVMTLEIRAPEGAGTRVDFGLSIAVEKGGYEHVKLTPLGGFGLFGWLFQNGVGVFHDEVMGEQPAHPDRYLATVGVNTAVNMVASFLAAYRARQQQH